MDAQKLDELKIRQDITHAFEIYSLDDLISEEEIEEGVRAVSEICKAYRHIHVELKSVLLLDYDAQFPEYEKKLGELMKFIKCAKNKLRDEKNRKGEEERRSREDDVDRLQRQEDEKEVLKENKQKEVLKMEAETFNLKIKHILDMFNLGDSEDICDIEDFLVNVAALNNQCFDLCARLKCGFGEEYAGLYGDKFDTLTRDLHDKIKDVKIFRRKVLRGKEEDSKNAAENLERLKQLECAKNLSKEIVFRCTSLESIFVMDLDALSDYQILEFSKDKTWDSDFNDILNKVTTLASFSPFGGKDVKILLDEGVKKRDDLAKMREKFSSKLQAVIMDRDISESKIKGISDMKFDLPKFTGYDGKMDFYTFKTKFKKLVEPAVQKKYWPDYLKRNYLDGLALVLVEREEEYSKIWDKLSESFGDARLLLQNKLGDLDKIGGLWKLKGDSKIGNAIAGLINSMSELSSLASEHNLEGQLYEGGGLEKIMTLIGEHRHRKFRSQNLDTVRSKKEEWGKLVKFLKDELLLREKLMLDNKTATLMGLCPYKSGDRRDIDKPKTWPGSHHISAGANILCSFCDKQGHTVVTTTKGNQIIPYYVCESFVRMSPGERFSKLKSKNLCTTCIFPGAVKGSRHRCFFINYCCPHNSHDDEKIHVLLCDRHKKESSNIKLFEKFKEKFITNCKVQLPQFSRHLSCFSEMVGLASGVNKSISSIHENNETDITESAIFQLQTIEVEGIRLNLFFDSGCGDMVVKKNAVDKLVSIGRAKQVIPGPLTITGVGDHKSVCDNGVYSIRLPLYDGSNAIISGLCMPKITGEFPMYTLCGVENDIHDRCLEIGGKKLVDKLPKLPLVVGGDTDILLGIKYAKYFPREVYVFDTGLGIYESVFCSPCGARAVVSGPHKEFSKIEENFKGLHIGNPVYCESVFQDFRNLFRWRNDVPLLGVKAIPNAFEIDDFPISCFECMETNVSLAEMHGESDRSGRVYAAKKAPRCVRQFDELENAGTDVTFRCIDCRSCTKCKNGLRYDAISFQEEREQALIERCIQVDPNRGITTAKLPFVVEPDVRLVPNRYEALKVYRGQVKKLSSKPEDKLAVIQSEQKLQSLGFVDFVDDLESEERRLIFSSLVRYIIPWRAAWNPKSISTPCRLVFDASQGTRGGCSLNSLLAKGANSMNNLLEILIRWTTYSYAFHTDIQKMYNAVRLDGAFWRYQLYLWNNELLENVEPRLKVIKTLIYGVRSSGNLAECGLRRTAEICKEEYPRVYEVIMSDMYVDDCVSGAHSAEEVRKVTDELSVALLRGGFILKGFTFSGHNPPENLSGDQESVTVGGLKWFPKGDFLQLNISDLNFNKKFRGRKASTGGGTIPEFLSKKDCISKVGEVWDPLGRVAPITGGMKLDISELHKRELDWDDPIPGELKNVWAANFDLMQEIRNIKFHRAIVPLDAVNLDIDTIDVGDAGEHLVCAAIYARFKLKSGKYSCQLIFARTKVVHDHTIPRAELVAALLNASTGHLVRRSLKSLHKRSWKLTDSQVVLHWLNCTKSALKMWVRNRVAEICRLVDLSSWRYVSSENNIADLGTRKGAKMTDVMNDSLWSQGYPWMSDVEENFPLKTVNELVLSSKLSSEANKERVILDSFDLSADMCLAVKYVPNEVGERFRFSKYLINPNKHRFRTVVRILGLVLLFIKKLNRCNKNRRFNCLKSYYISQSPDVLSHVDVKGVHVVSTTSGWHNPVKTDVAVVHLSEDILNAARCYFFRKATMELEKFVDPILYKNKSVKKEGILYYSGRILATQEIDGKFGLGDAILDLSAATFCVPIIDSFSPVAYAIVSETHWHNPNVKHGGVESVLRYSQQMAYIVGGRGLVKSIKKGCARCRVLHKKAVRVVMGPIGENNLKIAPVFYYCQVDICGPFKSYSPVNKRASIKIWIVVFCCTVTGAVDSRVMENYTADAFVLAFIRFACRYGYPKIVMPDEGSQLVKGCQDMVISFSDIHNKISTEYGVEFKTCPVGAHYVHGKVERKIQEIKRSLVKTVCNDRLSILQWETLVQQISNNINNMPIGLGNKTEMLENLDILTPNRLILGRNNNRNPTAPLVLSQDFRRIVEANNEIFKVWFREWLISYVPSLIEQPKWFVSERDVCAGDVVIFFKSEQEFDRQYQYGIVVAISVGRDGRIRVAEVEYQNSIENFKRRTKRGVRDLVVIHQVDEVGISAELQELADDASA